MNYQLSEICFADNDHLSDFIVLRSSIDYVQVKIANMFTSCGETRVLGTALHQSDRNDNDNYKDN